MIPWPALGHGPAVNPLRALLKDDLRPNWQEAAPCIGKAEIMFGPDEHRAKAICAGCPVMSECLRLALDTESTGGIWAGMTHEERLGTCPVCLGPKPRSALACNFPHVLERTARLIELQAMGDPDVNVARRQVPTARTAEWCPIPRGRNHASARSYRRGCRCDESKEALRQERLGRGTHAAERGPYQARRVADG